MYRRIAASFLWAVTIYSGWELGWGVYGIPREIGPVVALIVAAVVLLDPGHFIWKAAVPVRRIAQIPDPKGAGQRSTQPN